MSDAWPWRKVSEVGLPEVDESVIVYVPFPMALSAGGAQ